MFIRASCLSERLAINAFFTNEILWANDAVKIVESSKTLGPASERTHTDHCDSAADAKYREEQRIGFLNSEGDSSQERLRKITPAPFTMFVFKNVAYHAITLALAEREEQKSGWQ